MVKNVSPCRYHCDRFARLEPPASQLELSARHHPLDRFGTQEKIGSDRNKPLLSPPSPAKAKVAK